MNARSTVPHALPDSSWELSVGMVFSVLLHLLVAFLAIFGLPFVLEPPPPVEELLPVDLVPLGPTTTAPPPKVEEQKPVEKPPEKPPEPPKQEVKQEPPKPEPPKPEPPKEQAKVETPKPTPAPPPPPPPPPPPKAELPAPPPKPEPPKDVPKPSDQLAEVKPQKKPPPPPDTDFQSLLKTLDKMKKPPEPKDDLAKTIEAMRQPETPPAPQPQPPQPTTSTAHAAAISLQPTASDLDFVSAQVARHWNFDIGGRDAATMIVNIHVVLQPDGTVVRADCKGDPRYNQDSFYTSAADSACRAVLAASPLQLPPGKSDVFKDFTFRFDPRNALR